MTTALSRKRILLVEDDAGHARLVSAALSRSMQRMDLEWIDCLSSLAPRLQSKSFDAVLLDLTLPDSSGGDTIAAVRAIDAEIPIVVLTSMASDRIASESLELGAQDYLVKEELLRDGGGTAMLVRALRYAILREEANRQSRLLLHDLQASQFQLERKNRRLAKLCKTAERFVDDVSHEFRTPLTVIKEYVSLLRDGLVGPVNAEQCQFIDVVSDRADDLNRMVDDMLDISKLGAGLLAVRRTGCRLSELSSHVLQSMRRKALVKGVTLEFDVPENLPEVYCDPDKVDHVLINLGINAIKFCGDPGHVRVWARVDSVACEAIVGVTDNGPGIEPKQLQRLFRRFKQLNRKTRDSTKGFGLGLSIAKKLVEMNFGRLNICSVPNEGTTFSFTLPLASPLEVARRYLDRLSRTRGLRTAHLIDIVATAGAQSAEVDELDCFLHDLLRPTDLLFRLTPGHWALLLAASPGGLERFWRRCDRAILDANRNRIHGPMATFDCVEITHWNSNEDTGDLLSRLQELTVASSAADVGQPAAGEADLQQPVACG